MRKRGRENEIRLAVILGCLLALVSVALWGQYAAAAEEDDAELLRPMANWSPAQHISTTSGNGAFVPVIRASSTGRLMIMYNHETNAGVENPFYSQSTDGGDTWSTPAPVHSSDTDAHLVAFDFAGDMAHAIWRTRTQEQSEVFDKIWHAREGQWATNGSTLIVDAGERIFNLEIAAAPDGVIHVAWSQADNKLYHSLSRNGGGTWSPPQALTTGQNKADTPSIAIDQNGDAHIVWEERIIDGSTFLYEIRYRKGNVTPSTVNWDPHLNLATSSDPNQAGDPRQPTIVAEGNDLHVGFSRRLESNEQYPYYVGYSANNGWDSQTTNTSPGNPVEVNTNTPFYLVSTVAACGDAIHLYYHGVVDPNLKEQILGTSYKANWSARAAVTEPDVQSINPSMVCTGATVHLVYSLILTVNDNHQIYYVRLSPTVYLPSIYR